MKTNSTIRESSKTSDRIYLGAINLKRPFLIPVLISYLLITVLNVYFISQMGLTFLTLTLCVTTFGLLLIATVVFRKLLAEAYLKQDNFIVKYLRNNQAKVMCVKCVRKIHTYKLFGLYLSLITYKLDGVKQRALVFGSVSKDQNPKQLILQAKNLAA
jgi:hypothetical protein